MTPEELKQTIRDFSDSVGSLKTTVGTLSDSLKGFTGGVVEAGKTLVQVSAGLMSMNAGSEQAYVVFKQFAGMLGMPTMLSEGIVQASKDLKTSMAAGGADTVAQMSLNAAIMMKTRDEMTKYTTGLGSQLLNLGGTTRQAQQELVNVTQEFMKTSKAEKLRQQGLDPALISEFATQIAIANRYNLKDAKDRQRLTEATNIYADTLLEQAQRTNVPITTLNQQMLEKIVKDPEQRAMMDMLRDPRQREGFNRATTALRGTLGEGLTKLAQTRALNLPPDKAAIDMMNVIGPQLTSRLTAATRQMMDATTEPARTAAKANMDAVISQISARINDPRVNELMMMTPQLRGDFLKLKEEIKVAQGLRTIQQERPGTTYEDAQKIQEERARRDREGLDPETGKKRTDRQVEEFVIQMEKMAHTAAVNLATEIKKATDEMKPDTLSKYTDTLNKVNKEFENKKPIEDFLKFLRGEMKPEEKKEKKTPEQQKAEDRLRDVIKKDHGTLGTTGEMKEPKDILAMLHKGERVLNPRETEDLNEVFRTFRNFKPSSAPMIDPSQFIEQMNIKIPEKLMERISVSRAETKMPEIKLPDFSSVFKQITPATIKMPFDLNALVESTKSRAEKEKTEVNPPQTATVIPSRTFSEEKQGTMNDVVLAINQLNKTMHQMLEHTQTISNNSEATSRIAGKLSGNRLYG